MNINIKDAVTLSDDRDYVVVSKVSYEGNIHYYLVAADNSGDVKFCTENSVNSSFFELEDSALIQKLLPLFIEASSKALTKEDLELLEQSN